MDRDLALIVANAGQQACRELTGIMPMLAKHLPDDKELRLGIAAVIHEISVSVIEPAFRAHPDLEAEFEARVKKYDRYI